MTPRTNYKRLRKVGYRAADALRFSKAMELFSERDGATMRFRFEPDDYPDLSFLDDWPEDRTAKASAKAIRDMAERDGVWVAFLETRRGEDGQWIVRDCIGGLIGSPGLSVEGADGNALPLDYAGDMILSATSLEREQFGTVQEE